MLPHSIPLCLCGCGHPIVHPASRWLRGHSRRNLPLEQLHAAIRRKLATKYEVFGPAECHLWTGYTMPNGYGTTRVEHRQTTVHRAAWILEYGPIPDGLEVLHSCGIYYPPQDITYRRCIRLDHLHLGDSAMNNRETSEKGRHPLGEQNTLSKLTEADVRNIRRLLVNGWEGQEVAAHFGVSKALVSLIRNRKIWTHI